MTAPAKPTATICVAGRWVAVDADDLPRVQDFGWTITNGYVYSFARRDGRRVGSLARWILGVTDPALHVHHRNGDKFDNRRSNLVALTPLDHLEAHLELRRSDHLEWRRPIPHGVVCGCIQCAALRRGRLLEIEVAA